jgi:predicted MFS family arabinose efflux permease
MIAADILRATLVLAIPAAATLSIYLAYALAFLVASVSLFFEPARLTLLPELLPGDQLMRANSLDNASMSVSELLGLAVGGAVVAGLGLNLAFVVDSLTFLVSSAFVLAVRHRTMQLSMDIAEQRTGIASEVGDGLRHVWDRPVLRDLFGVQTLAALAIFGTITLANLLALDYFAGGAAALASLDAAITLGLLVGSIMVGRSRRGTSGAKFLGGVLGVSAVCIAVGVFPLFAPALLLLFLGGIANMWCMVPMTTILQTHANADMRGRVFAARTAISRVAGVIGLVGAGALAQRIGVPQAFVVFGSGGALAALLGWLRPALRQAA